MNMQHQSPEKQLLAWDGLVWRLHQCNAIADIVHQHDQGHCVMDGMGT